MSRGKNRIVYVVGRGLTDTPESWLRSFRDAAQEKAVWTIEEKQAHAFETRVEATKVARWLGLEAQVYRAERPDQALQDEQVWRRHMKSLRARTNGLPEHLTAAHGHALALMVQAYDTLLECPPATAEILLAGLADAVDQVRQPVTLEQAVKRTQLPPRLVHGEKAPPRVRRKGTT